MEDFSVWREGVHLACNPVGETRADSYYKIGLLDRLIGGPAAMHADKAGAKRMVGRKSAKTHQAKTYRGLEPFGKAFQAVAGVRDDHSAARVDDWPFSRLNEFDGALDALSVTETPCYSRS